MKQEREREKDRETNGTIWETELKGYTFKTMHIVRSGDFTASAWFEAFAWLSMFYETGSYWPGNCYIEQTGLEPAAVILLCFLEAMTVGLAYQVQSRLSSLGLPSGYPILVDKLKWWYMPGRVCVQSQFKTHSKSKTISGYVMRPRHPKKRKFCMWSGYSVCIDRKEEKTVHSIFLSFVLAWNLLQHSGWPQVCGDPPCLQRAGIASLQHSAWFLSLCYTVFPCNQRLCVSHESFDYKRQKPNSNQFMQKGKVRWKLWARKQENQGLQTFSPIRIAFLFPFLGTIFLYIDFILNKSVPSR